MTAVFAILSLQALAGAFDNLWHHELEARLPQRISAVSSDGLYPDPVPPFCDRHTHRLFPLRRMQHTGGGASLLLLHTRREDCHGTPSPT